MKTATLTIGPDINALNGIAFHVTVGGQHVYSDGFDSPKARHPQDPEGWVSRARRRCKLPRCVRMRGLGWADAQVTPIGWSQGAGHAPQGVKLTWEL